MEQTLSWSKPTSFDEIENFGIYAGDEDGNKVFVGRAIDRDGNFVPAKVIPALKSSFYAFNDTEESADQVEFLDNAGDYHWVKSVDANIEDAAKVAGSFIGRSVYNGNVVVGRVDEASKQLIGSYDGETFKLASYDVLIYKSKGVVYETIQKASNVKQFQTEFQTDTRFSQTIINNGFHETSFDSSSYIDKIRKLESERHSYLKDKQIFEERLDFESRKVAELSQLVKRLKIENSRFLNERQSFEERFSSEQQKLVLLETKLNEYTLNNAYLMKKVTTLEESIRFEKQMVESVAEKFSKSETYSQTLLTKVGNFEETIKTQQQRIFELESEIMVTSSSSESLLKRVSEYEETIKFLRIQMEGVLKRLEISSNDNEFLIKKLAMLTQTLRTYQGQIECLTNKLQSAKTVIATAHSDLSRANLQISKYQAALSSCYTVNGELMTKVSGLNAAAQYQVGSDCHHNLINYSSTGFGYGQIQKSLEFTKTSTLFELTGSDITFLEVAEAQGNAGFQSFTPYKPTEAENNAGFQQFTPYNPTPATNGVTEDSAI